jgi:hypothetical protein
MAQDKTGKTSAPVATLATSATWGIPDWRDASAYVDSKDWNLDNWRWEFLRRREDYRADFVAAAETLETISTRFRHDGASVYDLEEFYDPRIRDWGALGPLWHPLPLPDLDADGFPLRHGALHEITFDLSKSLAPQLAEAKAQLQTEQGLRNLSNIEAAQLCYGVEFSGKPEIPVFEILEKANRRPRAPKYQPEKWLKYLRAVDAREVRTSWAEITAFFFKEGLLDRRIAPEGGYCAPPPQAARDLWLQAQALRF